MLDGDDPGGGACALSSSPPGKFAHSFFSNANAWGLARWGGGGGWALLESTYALLLNIYRLTHSASELSEFTCTSSLTMNEKFQYRTRQPRAVLKISSSLLGNECR